MSSPQSVNGIDLQHAQEDTRKDGHVDSYVDGGKANAGSHRAIVIVLANHTGGVTKTTSTANLGAMLAERGCRVLVVDCDPQANLSEAFGWTEEVGGTRLEDLIAHPDGAPGFAPRGRCTTWSSPRFRACGSWGF